MDVSSLSLKITTEGMEQAQAKMDGVTKSAAVLEAQTTKLTASTTRLGPASRMTGEEIDALKASYEKLRARQDAFLQDLDKQAATLNKGGAAMRAYTAEKLGLTDGKVFQRLNAQVAEAESASSGVSRMMENMVLRMGLHMALFITVMKGVSWAYDEIVHGAQKWMDQAAKMADSDAKSASSVATLAMAMKTNAESYANGTNVVNGYNGMLERESVLRAEMMAMGPEFRNAIYQENGHYSDQLTLLKQITAEKLKQTNAQIEMVERDKPSGSALVGLGAGLSAVPGIGGLLMSSGLRDDVDEQVKYDERLDKLYKARAELMKSIATLNGDYQKGADSMASIYEVNHRIYELEKITPLSAEKSVSANLLAPATEKASFNFQKLEDSTTTLMRKMRDAAESGDMFAAMGYEVANSSGYAADALTRWSTNVDGLGVSWTTLGNTVRNVLADMIRQMERAIIQQQLMDPLLKWAGVAISGFAAGGSGLSTSGVAPSGWTGMTTAAPPSGAGPQASIVVNVNSDGTAKATSQDASKAGTDLAQMMEPVMNAWAIKQSRSGGILARA